MCGRRPAARRLATWGRAHSETLVSCGREMRSALLRKMASLSSVQSGEKELRGHHRHHRVARVSWGRVGPWPGTES